MSFLPKARSGFNGFPRFESFQYQGFEFLLRLLVGAGVAFDVLRDGQALRLGTLTQQGFELGVNGDCSLC